MTTDPDPTAPRPQTGGDAKPYTRADDLAHLGRTTWVVVEQDRLLATIAAALPPPGGKVLRWEAVGTSRSGDTVIEHSLGFQIVIPKGTDHVPIVAQLNYQEPSPCSPPSPVASPASPAAPVAVDAADIHGRESFVENALRLNAESHESIVAMDDVRLLTPAGCVSLRDQCRKYARLAREAIKHHRDAAEGVIGVANESARLRSEVARATAELRGENERLREELDRRDEAGNRIMRAVKPLVGEFVTEAVERVAAQRDAAADNLARAERERDEARVAILHDPRVQRLSNAATRLCQNWTRDGNERCSVHQNYVNELAGAASHMELPTTPPPAATAKGETAKTPALDALQDTLANHDKPDAWALARVVLELADRVDKMEARHVR